MEKQDKKQKYDKEQKYTVLVVVISSFITTFTGSALNLSVPDISSQLGASASSVGWVVTVYTLTVAALSVPFGRLADLTCRKTVMAIGLGIFSAACIAIIFTPSMMYLIGARAVQGIGAAMVFSTNTAILISRFPGKSRGRVLGYSLASTYVGLSAGPVIGGVLNHYIGWRSIFTVTAVVSALIFLIAQKMLAPHRYDGSEKKQDVRGNILFCAMIVLTMYGLSEMKLSPMPIILTAAGLCTTVIFVRHELKTAEPLIRVELFKGNAGFTFSNLAALLNYGATFAIGYLLSIYLQVVMGYSSGEAGLILIVQPAIMAILSPYAGRLSDRFSPFKLSSAGMALCAGGLVIFIFLTENTELWVVMTGLAVTGLGFALFSSPNTNAVMSCVEKEDYGVASSILATMRSVGHTFSMVIVTIIVGIYMGEKALTDASTELLVKTMRVSFIICFVLCFAGIFLALKRKEKDRS